MIWARKIEPTSLL